MPVEIIGGYPCKNCGGSKVNAREETIFYWVEINHLLREDSIYYICRHCEKILIKVINHTEEKY